MIKRFLNFIILKRRKEIPFIIFFSFLLTFFVARLIAHAINMNTVPDSLIFIQTVYVKGYHIHHFNFGIILIIISSFLGLIDVNRDHLRKTAMLFGIGLALIVDEFGLLVTLNPDAYWNRGSYDAVIITGLILLNVAYFRGFWKVMGRFIKSPIKKFIAWKKDL